MNTRSLLLLFLFIGFFNGNSQNKKNVLLTINTNPVYSSDFTKVFNKNLDLVVEESQKNVAGYLDLFIDYKLKITEAYAQELDKNKLYIKCISTFYKYAKSEISCEPFICWRRRTPVPSTRNRSRMTARRFRWAFVVKGIKPL